MLLRLRLRSPLLPLPPSGKVRGGKGVMGGRGGGGGGENHGVSSAYAPFGDATRCARLVDGVGFKIQSEFA